MPYHLICYDRDTSTRLAPLDYKALHSSGSAPVITDGELTLAESGAIIDYIVAKYGAGRLTVTVDNPAFGEFLYWYHIGNGSLMPSILLVMGGGDLASIMRKRLDGNLAALESRLSAGHRWLAGADFTIADIMSSFPLMSVQKLVGLDLSPYPHISAYLRRITNRPAYQHAKLKADTEPTTLHR